MVTDRTNNDRKNEAGFTLLIVPLVLLMVAFVFAATAPKTQTQNFYVDTETKTHMVDVKQTLASFAHRNYRIPCPADPSINPADPAYGTEATNPPVNGALNLLDPCQLEEGILPFRDLGITEYEARDEWGNYYTYAVSESFAKQPLAKQVGGIYDPAGPNNGIPGEFLPVAYENTDVTDPLFASYAGEENEALTMTYVHEYCRRPNWVDAGQATHRGIDGNLYDIDTNILAGVNRNIWKAQFCCSSIRTGNVVSGGEPYRATFITQEPSRDRCNATGDPDICDAYDRDMELYQEALNLENEINNYDNPRTSIDMDFDTGQIVASGSGDISISIIGNTENTAHATQQNADMMLYVGESAHGGGNYNSGLGFKFCMQEYTNWKNGTGTQNQYNNCRNDLREQSKLWKRSGSNVTGGQVMPFVQLDFKDKNLRQFAFTLTETIESEVIYYSVDLYTDDGDFIGTVNDFQEIHNGGLDTIDKSEISEFQLNIIPSETNNPVRMEVALEKLKAANGTIDPALTLENVRMGSVTIKPGGLNIPKDNDTTPCSETEHKCHILTVKDSEIPPPSAEIASNPEALAHYNKHNYYGGRPRGSDVYAQSLYFGGFSVITDENSMSVPPTPTDISVINENGNERTDPRNDTNYASGNEQSIGVPTNYEAPTYALISHGENGIGAYIGNGTVTRVGQDTGYAGASVNELENINAPGDLTVMDGRSVKTGNGTQFDDIVMWDTQFSLYNALSNASCESAL